jgi:hypothetical protein
MRSHFLTSTSNKNPIKFRLDSTLAVLLAFAYFHLSTPMVYANEPAASDVVALIGQSMPSAVESAGGRQQIPLTGGVDTKEQSQLSQNINLLLDSALTKKTAFAKSEAAVNHYRAPKQKVWTKVKDASNFLVPWHGFGPSSEAGDVVLNEKLKLKSLEASGYARQKEVDEMHLVVVEKMLGLAESAGAPSSFDQKASVNLALGELSALTSPDDAQKTLAMIKELDLSQVAEAVNSIEAKPLSVVERKRKWKELSESFISNDPVAQEVTRRFHLYNKRGAVTNVSGHVIEATLGMASLVPNVLGPASQGCLMTYEMANGGTEENKLIKELYLEKRLQSRCRLLVEEAHLVIDTCESALMAHNYSLAALCKAVMIDLGDERTVASVLNSDSATGPKLAGTAMVTQ